MVHWFAVLSSEVRNPVANKALIIRQKKHCPGLNFRPRAMLSIFITRDLSATACRTHPKLSGRDDMVTSTGSATDAFSLTSTGSATDAFSVTELAEVTV